MPGFHCHTCGEWHDELPLDVGFDEPLHVDELTAEERARSVTGAGDFRTLTNDEGVHYFIHGVIEIPVTDLDDSFCYGVWASLSHASYEAALAAYRADTEAGPFFGWLCNSIPGYPDTLTLKTNVRLRPKRKPAIILEAGDHPLAVEQHRGISRERVLEIVGPLLHEK